ncbi:lipopolysaccharide-induced tumor necrosis factor-alpha factor homolog [Convolutriloba macropyga]|uniref:lipopolysaccharide-induced tumor necrosis factor-alpha factor homolog n=1 Tax=Convolutriloba macropyga TaxID=536237 RepID=UPI003F5275DE
MALSTTTTTTVVNTAPTPVVIAQPTVTVVSLGRHPVTMTCPMCKATVTTRIRSECGMGSWLICLVLFLLGLELCCWLPLIIPSCQDTAHFCPNCNHHLGTKAMC